MYCNKKLISGQGLCCNTLRSQNPPFFSSRGAAPPGDPARADAWAGHSFPATFVVLFAICCDSFWRSTSTEKNLIFFPVKFHVECMQIHVWGPPGARVMTIFKKTYICVKVELIDNHV